MKLAELIAIAAVASILTQNSVFAQETPPAVVPVPAKAPGTEKQKSDLDKANAIEQPKSEADKAPTTEKPNSDPAPEKKYIGPAIQFGGGSTSFGIAGKYTLSEQFSVRPIFLFGYKPSVTKSNLNQAFVSAGISQSELNTPAGQTALDSTLGGIGTGFGYGASIVYDFKSPDGKMVGYFGPRLLIGSTSSQYTLTDGTNSIPNTTIDTSETNIGLTAGADLSITPNLTAGINATYNLYRSLKIGKADPLSTGSSIDFGINVTYGF
jgi:Opacity family porin protein